MVSDWSFGGPEHLWYQILHHESALYVIPDFYADFQLPSSIKIASRWLYLEGIDVS